MQSSLVVLSSVSHGRARIGLYTSTEASIHILLLFDVSAILFLDH